MITCWVALDDTQAGGGTIEYVRGSHRWPKTPPDRGSFHAPDDWLAPMEPAAPDGVEPERVPVVVKAGGCAFHHSLTFHGSGPQRGDRRAARAGLPPDPGRDALPPARTPTSPTRATAAAATSSLDESFFPVLWDETGGRSAWLAALPELP